jgi:hypothetical protein
MYDCNDEFDLCSVDSVARRFWLSSSYRYYRQTHTRQSSSLLVGCLSAPVVGQSVVKQPAGS